MIHPEELEAQMRDRAAEQRAEIHIWSEASGQALHEQEDAIVESIPLREAAELRRRNGELQVTRT